jgi:hypothetical protein
VAGVVHDLDGCFVDSGAGCYNQAGEPIFADGDAFEAIF